MASSKFIDVKDAVNPHQMILVISKTATPKQQVDPRGIIQLYSREQSNYHLYLATAEDAEIISSSSVPDDVLLCYWVREEYLVDNPPHYEYSIISQYFIEPDAILFETTDNSKLTKLREWVAHREHSLEVFAVDGDHATGVIHLKSVSSFPETVNSAAEEIKMAGYCSQLLPSRRYDPVLGNLARGRSLNGETPW